MSEEPAWMRLAQHLASYVKIEQKHYLRVFIGKCFGEPAVIIRVYMVIEIDKSYIRSTVTIGPDEAVCADCERGIRFIDLHDPKACEMVLDWMILVGIVPEGAEWRDPD